MKRGSILLITLWLVAALSALAVAIARHVSLELRVVRYRIAGAQTRALAQGGVRLAMEVLQADLDEGEDGNPKTQYDWLGDDWARPLTIPVGPAGTDVMTVTITDEERKFKLRDVKDAVQLERLVRLGVDRKAAEAIVDYQDTADPAENRDHPPYRAKNEPIDVLEEALDIPDVSRDPGAFPILQKMTTTANNIAKINFNTAEGKVLQSFIDPNSQTAAEDLQMIRDWIDGRKGKDGQWGTDDDCRLVSRSSVLAEPSICIGRFDQAKLSALLSRLNVDVVSWVFEIEVNVARSNPTATHRIDAVVDRSPAPPAAGQAPAPSGPRITAWRDG